MYRLPLCGNSGKSHSRATFHRLLDPSPMVSNVKPSTVIKLGWYMYAASRNACRLPTRSQMTYRVNKGTRSRNTQGSAAFTHKPRVASQDNTGLCEFSVANSILTLHSPRYSSQLHKFDLRTCAHKVPGDYSTQSASMLPPFPRPWVRPECAIFVEPPLLMRHVKMSTRAHPGKKTVHESIEL